MNILVCSPELGSDLIMVSSILSDFPGTAAQTRWLVYPFHWAHIRPWSGVLACYCEVLYILLHRWRRHPGYAEKRLVGVWCVDHAQLFNWWEFGHTPPLLYFSWVLRIVAREIECSVQIPMSSCNSRWSGFSWYSLTSSKNQLRGTECRSSQSFRTYGEITGPEYLGKKKFSRGEDGKGRETR